MSSKLIRSHEDIFAKMVVDAVLTLDEELNEKLIGIKKVLGGAVEVVVFIVLFCYLIFLI